MAKGRRRSDVGKRGPKPGTGGRPRKRLGSHAANSEGYARITVGSKKNPKRIYEHQAATGVRGGSKGSKTVVDHKDGNKLNNKRSNLRVTSRGKNANRSR